MTTLYADTSAVVGAYLPDEPENDTLAGLLLDGEEPVVTSVLTRVEFASAASAAARARRIRSGDRLRQRFDLDCSRSGPLTLIQFDAAVVLPLARDLVSTHTLRTLDAIHLAVAVTTASQMDDDVVMLTRDARQAAAAKELGIEVR